MDINCARIDAVLNESAKYRRPYANPARTGIVERFGVRSLGQLRRDLSEVVRDGLRGRRFQAGLSSVGHLRPDVGLPAHAGFVRIDGMAPIINLFDRSGGGTRYSQRVTRNHMRDFRGGRLSYDEHDGVDIVCPVGTPLLAAAPGHVVMIRDTWLRGGLTVTVDHGSAVMTQYTHCSRALVKLGQWVQRGESIALSGVSGIDMTTFYPWVPPHLHFSVWHHGVPVDPFQTDTEARKTAVWARRNDPRPADAYNDEPIPAMTAVNKAAVEAAIEGCRSARIIAELEALAGHPHYQTALLEDALHHDAHAWREGERTHRLGTADAVESSVLLSLPLPAEDYKGVFFADCEKLRERD